MKNFIEVIEKNRPYVIAEIGINHNGDMILAKEMIDAAKENNASCVKFQSFIANNYISKYANKANYQKKDASVKNISQRDIIKQSELSTEQAIEMYDYAKSKNIDFLSTPFEIDSFYSLMKINVPAIKISSCNLTNIPFLEEVASSKIPVLLSTGMGNLGEVIKAVEIFKKSKSSILLFQCTSNYPSNIKNANLNVIKTYRNLFNVPIGYSDHTKNNIAAIVSVSLGAIAIEKHFTISRDLPGIDQKASIEPSELAELVQELKDAYQSLGSSNKFQTPEEVDTAVALRRSVVAKYDLEPGTKIEKNMISMKRPGDGMPAEMIDKIIGEKKNTKILKDEKILLNHFFSL